MKIYQFFLICISIAFQSVAQNTILVTNLNDSGQGSLRQAIAVAILGDTVDLRNLTGTILLNSELAIGKSLHLIGPGMDKLKISGQNNVRIFRMGLAGSQVHSLTDLSLIDGFSGDTEFENPAGGGGCIMYVNGSSSTKSELSINRVEFKNCNCTSNFADADFSVEGGAIVTLRAGLTIKNSQFIGNTAHNTFGISAGGAISAQLTDVSIFSSTFYNNTATTSSAAGSDIISAGGAIMLHSNGQDLPFQIDNSTFSQNSSDVGAALFVTTTTPGTVQNSTFAFNQAASEGSVSLSNDVSFANCLFHENLPCDIFGGFKSLGANLFNPNPCNLPSSAEGPPDLYMADALIEQITNNGGPTLTHALKLGSSAINAGFDSNPPTYDQRGQPRVRQGQIDIGSYESNFNNFNADFSFVSNCNGLVEFQDESLDPNNEVTQYEWNFGDGIGSSAEQNPNYTYLIGGSFSVTLTVKTLTDESTITKTVLVEGGPPVITILGDNPQTLFLNQSYTDPGATAFDQIEGDLTASITQSSNIDNSIPGIYTVIYSVEDSCGFSATATRTIEVIQIPHPEINLGQDKILCKGNSLSLDAGSGYASYLWSTGATGSSITVTESGVYSIIVTNQFNLTAGDAVTVNVVPLPDPTITTQFDPCNLNAVKLSAGVYSSYQWSTGALSENILVGQNGTYGVEVTDENGCKGSTKTSIAFKADPSCEPVLIKPLTVTAVCSDFPNLVRRWKITNPNTTGLRVDWEIDGTIQRSWIDVPSGDSYLTTIAIPNNTNTITIYWHNEKGEKKSLKQVSSTQKCAKGQSAGRLAANEFQDENAKIRVYPNPAKSLITIELNSDDQRETTIEIVSISGAVQQQRSINLEQGTNFIIQDVSNLRAGNYLIKAGYETLRFIKE